MTTKTKDLQLALNKLLKNIGSELFNKLTWDQKKFMAKTAGRLKLSRMKMKGICDHCKQEKPNLWIIDTGLSHYEICRDCKPLIEEFIKNDYTIGNYNLKTYGNQNEG